MAEEKQEHFVLGDPVDAKANGKKVNLSLSYAFGEYKVVSITNTTVVQPGQILKSDWVKNVCDNFSNWEVTMVDPNIGGQIFNFIKSIIPIPTL